MKIDDLTYSNSDLQNKIIYEAPKFYNEFIKNGIAVYRAAGLESDYVTTKQTYDKRYPMGKMRLTDSEVIEMVDELFFTRNGICSRIYNALYTITTDISKVGIKMDNAYSYYCVPLGDYSYSYIDGVSDFNLIKPTQKESYSIVNAIADITTLTYDYEIKYGLLAKLIAMGDTPILKGKVEELFEITDLNDSNDALDFYERIRTIASTASSDNMNSIYTNNTITSALYSPTELLFNCDKYLLISADKYNIEEVFPKFFRNGQ